MTLQKADTQAKRRAYDQFSFDGSGRLRRDTCKAHKIIHCQQCGHKAWELYHAMQAQIIEINCK